MIANKADTKERAFFVFVGVSTLILAASCLRADDAQPAGLTKLYVGKFESVERAPNGFGPLHALNADIRRIKADTTAPKRFRVTLGLADEFLPHTIALRSSRGFPLWF